jgi:carbonic anhydrase
VHVFDVRSGSFVAASSAEHSGTGPYLPHTEGQPDG